MNATTGVAAVGGWSQPPPLGTPVRFPVRADVRSAIGEHAAIRFGLEGGEIVALTPCGETFSMSAGAAADVIGALTLLGRAAELQRADLRARGGAR